ncbi:hypothetical protein AB0A76_12185 [Streptomyces exfoliatus]|uniref:Uncharacterized protein n=1 Tax=Streptomyces exfoliatus TaxID=1905 RepID=A0ABV3CWG3_STREX
MSPCRAPPDARPQAAAHALCAALVVLTIAAADPLLAPEDLAALDALRT